MMNNTALLQHIASEFIAHSGVPAKPAFDKISAGDETFINELSPSDLLELLENPLPIIINTLTGEPHSAIHCHSDDILPDCKNYAYGIGYESVTALFVLVEGIESYYLALKAKAYLKNQNYLPFLIKFNGLDKHPDCQNLYY
ncbi:MULTISPECIES: hypothetical protein [Morganellaceae]|uniref:hypothetical protein n=1 Tax=Morganellaceae TaxID=1903414 RepID=UPI001071ECC2|nr:MULTISPECIES: hypothetical protein [Morganellaceae]ELB3894168.1 hypothetical protein [Morganella morganii]ELR5110520.1 hypothetical protein [Providencia rettgeri]ELU1438587.1 hypothetical protein [Providencia rettgeri]ELY3857670.1 hypothetical protein [Providencia rettgeri]MBQ0308628.1 hypothetical protein [Providencia rettgeri]